MEQPNRPRWKRVIRRTGRMLWDGLAYAGFWAAMVPAHSYAAWSQRQQRRYYTDDLHFGAPPPPGYPERVMDDRPLTPQESLLWAELKDHI